MAKKSVDPDFFEVFCSCGRVFSGQRQTQHQVLSCSACGKPVFVLPRSPWHGSSGMPLLPGRWRTRDWLLPLGAMGLTLAVLVLFFFVYVWPHPNISPGPENAVKEPSVWERLKNARAFHSQGNFRQACAELKLALGHKNLDPGDERKVRLLLKEASVLADLLPVPLEEILHQAAGMEETEWLLEFQARYQGKSVVLDAEFHRDQGRTWKSNYQLMAGKEGAQLSFDNLDIFQNLPTHGSLRLVLGLRLAHIRREPPGPTWVVRFDKGSGVLLTDPEAVRRLCPDLANEAGVELLARQAAWVHGEKAQE